MIETTALSDLDTKLNEARTKRDALWDQFQAIEKEVEPYLERVKAARSAWYTQDQRVTVLETIKSEGLQ